MSNNPYHKPIDDMIGEKNDKLTIVGFVGTDKRGQRLWLCKCDCGNTTVKNTNSLHSKARHSCGCIRKNHPNGTKHGMCYTRLNGIYRRMKQRCINPNSPRYTDYGGRGIRVCKEWVDDFMNFYNWAIQNGYSDKLTLDRINNDGNYEPNNCRWATTRQQANNTRHNHILVYQGVSHTMAEWAEIKGLPYSSLNQRINVLKWPIDKALNTEVQR